MSGVCRKRSRSVYTGTLRVESTTKFGWIKLHDQFCYCSRFRLYWRIRAGRRDGRYPQKTTLYSRGMLWGFGHVTLEGERGTIQIVSTPDSGSGEPVVELVYGFDRRSGWAEGRRR